MSATWLTSTWPSSLARVHRVVCPQAWNPRACSRRFFAVSPTQQCSPSSSSSRAGRRRRLLTLAIETSCDDTCVAVLEKDAGVGEAAYLRFNDKITSDNRQFHGVHPMTAVASHTQHLAAMVQRAMRALPRVSERLPQMVGAIGNGDNDGGEEAVGVEDVLWVDGSPRKKPDFVTVTRGPGMMSNLSTGLNTAKGLAVAWNVPLLGVNHMQAHALTPRLVSALEAGERRGGEVPAASTGDKPTTATPAFPFFSILVSGGHSLLVLSRSLNGHAILAEARNIAIGDMLDKCAREIVPVSEISAGENVMYGALLERFAFPSVPSTEHGYDYEYQAPSTRADEIQIYDSGHGWTLTPPLSVTKEMSYEFAGLNGQVVKVLLEHPDMGVEERRLLAQHTMRLAFEHLASRLLLSLSPPRNKDGNANSMKDELLQRIRTVVVAGGVASNRYLMRILRATLDARGFGHIELICPPLPLCIDNAAMIAWTGMEMYEAGWQSELDILALRKWPLDPNAEGGGILGATGWRKVDIEEL